MIYKLLRLLAILIGSVVGCILLGAVWVLIAREVVARPILCALVGLACIGLAWVFERQIKRGRKVKQ